MHFYIRANESSLMFVDNKRIMYANERIRKPNQHFQEGTVNHEAMIALTADTQKNIIVADMDARADKQDGINI